MREDEHERARTLTIRRPDDWHLHLRDGAALAAVVGHSARHFGRAIVMPNLRPPVVTTADALGLLGQTWAQAHLPPTRCAIIMSMEPVFASFFAVWLGGEDLTARLLVGGTLVLVAMLTVELAPRRALEGEVPHIAV